MPGAGELRDKIRFESRGDDINGDPLGDWEERFTRSAQIIYLRGGEGVIEQRQQGVQSVVIVVRDGEETRRITSGWRGVNVRNGAEVFNLGKPAPSKDRGFIDIIGKDEGADRG